MEDHGTCTSSGTSAAPSTCGVVALVLLLELVRVAGLVVVVAVTCLEDVPAGCEDEGVGEKEVQAEQYLDSREQAARTQVVEHNLLRSIAEEGVAECSKHKVAQGSRRNRTLTRAGMT